MNRTYFLWYEFDANIVGILIATCVMNQDCSEYECDRIVKLNFINC